MNQFKIPVTGIIILLSCCFSSCNNDHKEPDAGLHTEHQKIDSSVSTGNYQMELTASPLPVEIAKPVVLSMKVKNTANENEPVLLDVVHDKKIHLIVVSENLGWFDHIHPEQQRDGSYTVTETFLHGGNYILFADYRPKGSIQLVHKTELTVTGKPGGIPSPQEDKIISIADGYTVTLVNAKELKTNTDQDLNITVEKDGKKLTIANLEQYLGAVAHIVMISKTDKEFIHIHSRSDGQFPISGMARFSKPGIYRVWVQFQTNGIVHTADFTVNVAEGKMEKEPDNKEHQH